MKNFALKAMGSHVSGQEEDVSGRGCGDKIFHFACSVKSVTEDGR